MRIMKLVIVESPGKVKHIQGFLGTDYKVVATGGHIRDLATSGPKGLGVDIDHDFKPTYVIDKDKTSLIQSLKEDVKEAEEVIIATDPDREGEAIAYHVATVLGLDLKTTKRVEFNEITKDVVLEGIKNPRAIDMNRVASQEARRIIDRIIGFGLSEFLKKYIKSESGGRVQSPVLKLVCEQDEKIDSFKPETYFSLSISIDILNKEYKLVYESYDGKKERIKDEKTAKSLLNCLNSSLTVSEVKRSTRTLKPVIPYDTASMQNEASSRLGLSTDKVQDNAQKLFYAGYLTYIRTDSTRMSPAFISSASKYIEENYGQDYVGFAHTSKKNPLFTQDAHEAIRPSNIYKTPEQVKNEVSYDQYRLYQIIYNHTLMSLMKPKQEDVLTIYFDIDKARYKLEFAKTIFPGYQVIEGKDTNIDEIPNIQKGDSFSILSKTLEEKQTEPPQHYTEGYMTSLMKKNGIGRPSTYTPTMVTLKKRSYVESNNQDHYVIATEKGKKTNHLLEKYFPRYVSVKYTAEMETSLDQIENGEADYLTVLKNANDDFQETLKKAKDIAYKEPEVETGELCPVCGNPLIYRQNKKGEQFIACKNWPQCTYVKPTEKEPPRETGELCPECGHPLIYRKNKKGEEFIGCSNYPACKYIKKEQKVDSSKLKKCPKCESGYLVKKKGPYGAFLAGNNPDCDYKENFKKRRFNRK